MHLIGCYEGYRDLRHHHLAARTGRRFCFFYVPQHPNSSLLAVGFRTFWVPLASTNLIGTWKISSCLEHYRVYPQENPYLSLFKRHSQKPSPKNELVWAHPKTKHHHTHTGKQDRADMPKTTWPALPIKNKTSTPTHTGQAKKAWQTCQPTHPIPLQQQHKYHRIHLRKKGKPPRRVSTSCPPTSYGRSRAKSSPRQQRTGERNGCWWTN